MEVVASLSQGRTAAVQCSLFTKKSVPVIFEPPSMSPSSVFLLFVSRKRLATDRSLAEDVPSIVL